MNEFLFRGKMTAIEVYDSIERNGTLPDPWVDGSLMHETDIDDRYYILANGIFSRESDCAYCCAAYEVEPESIGQYIGKEDANGRKIFTGDIISVGGHTVAVQLRGTQFVALKRNGVPLSWMIATHGVVIGNMFDNPELFDGDSPMRAKEKKGTEADEDTCAL